MKRDIRNVRKPLLARLQRKIDEENSKREKNYKLKLKEKKEKLKKENFGLDSLDFNFEPELKLIKLNNTRLSLYNKRGRR